MVRNMPAICWSWHEHFSPSRLPRSQSRWLTSRTSKADWSRCWIRGLSRKKRERKATAIDRGCGRMCLLFPIAAVRGQTTESERGTISGVIYDASGAVIPLRNGAGHECRCQHQRNQPIADPAGEYSRVSIPAGHYTLEVSTPGFKIHRSDVTSEARMISRRLDIIMELGNVSESVEVIGKKSGHSGRHRLFRVAFGWAAPL